MHLAPFRQVNVIEISCITPDIPVSYTHLDVYKRQLLVHGTINVSNMEMEAITMKRITEAELAKELRERYIKTPPEDMLSLIHISIKVSKRIKEQASFQHKIFSIF